MVSFSILYLLLFSFQTHTDTSGIEMVQVSEDQKITKRGNYHFDIPAIMQVIAQMDDKVQLFNLKGNKLLKSILNISSSIYHWYSS